MKSLICILFYVSAFIIVWAMIGYPLSLKLIGKLNKSRKLEKDYNLQPTVTVMVVAHNEEKVIFEKMKNILELEYPKGKISFLISSDNSTDKTNDIVREFIANHPEEPIRLFEVEVRKGKTNAQNEAQKSVDTEFLVMTDANSMLKKNAVRELMAAFTTDEIVYVTGRLSIINRDVSEISYAEASYWDGDLTIREIEGRVQTVTAGNGALYACRTKDYYDFDPIKCHDSAMPPFYALNGKRAIANHDAIAYEKASELIKDEFDRKVRMYRDILTYILPDIRILNIVKYKWFSYFYFGHRTCRYLLWIAHFIIFISNIFLIQYSWLYLITFIGQVLFYLLAIVYAIAKPENKYLRLIYYYTITIIAQWFGVYNILTGKAKPFWEKAESTR